MIFKRNLCEEIERIFLLSVLAISVTQSQTVTSYTTPFPGIGARAAALSDAYTAETYDVSSMYWNPAALAFLQKSSIVASHFQEPEHNAMNENVAVPLLAESNALALSATVAHAGYGKRSLPANEFRFVQYGFDIACATEIIPSLSFGASIGMRYGVSGASHLKVAFSSFGVMYSPSPEISYGLAYNGIGSRINYTYDGFSTRLNQENLPRNLQIAARMRFPSSLRQTFLTIMAANEKNFGEPGLRYKGGVELYPVDFLALRTGYQVDPSKSAATYGIGVNLDRVQLDYAISPSRAYEQFQQLSVSITFGG
jgi:hypothetical protein